MLKMISKNIPIGFISKISRKEANSRKPIYQMHKWFGRKTDAIFRSILIALELENNKINDFESIYYKDNHKLLQGKIILDPFMGGGVTLVNTLRLGGKAIGIDINPVAWFITKNELQIPNLGKNVNDYSKQDLEKLLDHEFSKINSNIGDEIKDLYTTEIYDSSKNIRKKVEIMYVLWVKKVRCPKCGSYNKLFPSCVITKLKKKNFENYKICPKCGELLRGNEGKSICSKCGYKFNSAMGIYKGRKFECISCGTSWDIVKDIMKERKNPLPVEMYAIEYYDPDTKKKGFKIPDKKDLNKYNSVREKVVNWSKSEMKFIPWTEIPEGYNTKQVKKHNYKYWRQMFNYRQLYCISKILEEISKIEDEQLRELFLCIFSNMINANNMFCIYNSQYGKIEPLFGDHHMAPVANSVENNVWGTKPGRGSFIKYFKGFIKSKRFNNSPFERINIDGKSNNIILEGEKFCSNFANNFEELIDSKKNTILKCQGSENLSFLPDKSIDAVVTDPPYYSAINYGEISEFFYVWDRLVLKDKYNFFKPNHVFSNDEVTVNSSTGITKEEFLTRLSKCFSEIRRVLKDKSPLILTYNNSSPEGWQLLIEALINAGFTVEKTYPIHTELRAGLIDNRREKMNYDLIIIAKIKNKYEKDSIGIDTFMNKVEKEFKKTFSELNDNSLVHLDVLLIKVGKAFEIYSKYYPNVYKGNNKITIKEILEQIYCS